MTTYATHDVAPLVYPIPGDARSTALATHIASAWQNGQDWILMGDSRTVATGGRGVTFHAAMNAMMAQMYGGLRLLPIQSQFSAGSGSPVGPFPCRMATNGQGTVTFSTSTNGNLLPCGWTFYRATNAGANGGSQTMFVPDNHFGSQTCRYNNGGAAFYDKTLPIYADVWVVNNHGVGAGATTSVAGSEDIIVEIEETSGESNTWSGTQLGTETRASLGLNSTAFTCQKLSFGPFTASSAAHQILNVRGNTAASSAFAVVAQRLRFGTPAQQIGRSFTAMGYGGAKISDIWADTTNGGSAANIAGFGNMVNASPVLAKVGAVGVIHLCGQNDASQSATLAQVKAAMLNAIDKMRLAVGWSIPYIILNNPFNPGLSTVQSALESTYAQAWCEICDERPNVHFFNIRLALERYMGWNSTSHPAQVGTTGTMPAGLTYKGNWAVGASYVIDDIVTLDGGNGVAITVSGGAGTFTAGETVTQTTSGATGIFISIVGSEMFLQVLTGTFDGVAGHTLTGGSSGATKDVSAVRFDSLYGRTGTNMPNDFNPRAWCRCIANHTATWGNRPGSQSSGTDGHGEWKYVYSFCDPADPAHWHDDGALAVADAYHMLENMVFQRAVGSNALAPRLRGRGR